MKVAKASRKTTREKSLQKALRHTQRSLRKSEARHDKLIRIVGEHKREEDVLRDQGIKLQHIFRDAPGGIVVASNQGRIMEVNPAFCKFLGYPKLELIGRKIVDITHPEDREMTSVAMRLGIARGNRPFTSRLVKRCLHKNGQTRWLEVISTKVCDKNGKFACWVAQAMDITVHKLAEEASRKSEDKYRLLVDTINEGLSICDEHDRITFVNDGFCRMLGYSREELIGQHTTVLLDKANWKLLRKQIALRRTGGHDRYEISFRKKDGNPLFVLISPNPIYNDQEHYCGNFAVITDLTDRKRMEEIQRQRETEQARRENHERQEAILNAIPDPAWLKDASGRFLAVNTAWCRFTGVEAQDALDKTVYDVFPPASARNLDKEDRQVMRSRKHVRDERTLSGKDGELRWFDTIKRPIADTQGRVTGIAGIARDITLRKQAEEALRQSEEKYRQLFATETDAIMLADASTSQFIDMNESACRLYGYSRKGFLRLHQLDISAEPKASAQHIKDVIRNKTIQVPLRYHKKKDGTTFPVEVAANSFSLHGKEVICMAVRDITERLRAEEALRESELAERSLRKRLTMLQEVSLELSKVGSFDELCRQAVKLGLERLEFDRLGLWFALPNGGIQGSFGTDEKGHLRDERGIQHNIPPTHEVHRILDNKDRLSATTNVPLYNHRARTVGKGSSLMAALWDGDRVIGHLAADNLIHRRPFAPEDEQLLILYAIALGHLCSRQRAAETLRKSEAMLAESQKITHIGSWEWDLKTKALSWSRETYRIFGVSPESFEPTIENFVAFIHPDDREFVSTSIRKAIDEKTPYDLTHRIIGADGRERVIHEQGKVFCDAKGNPVRTKGTACDVTARKQAEEALRAARAGLISAREEERRRLSRELHDSLAQKLVAVDLRLKSFKDQFSASLDGPKVQALEELARQYQGAFDEMRHISRELYPAVLELMGLCDALEQLKSDMESNRTMVAFCCDSDVREARYPMETEICLYRIAQEAMSNAMRHGKPRNVEMSVAYDKGCLQLTVTDDGKGFDRNKANHNGLGLISMRERAEAVGGTLQVTSQSGRTCVEARVPVTEIER